MKTITTLLLLALTIFAAQAFADADSERANLAKIVGEIDYLSRTLEVYRADAPSGGRYVFDYSALRRDLQAIRRGISEYIDRDLSLARKIAPLRESYIDEGGR